MFANEGKCLQCTLTRIHIYYYLYHVWHLTKRVIGMRYNMIIAGEKVEIKKVHLSVYDIPFQASAVGYYSVLVIINNDL